MTKKNQPVSLFAPQHHRVPLFAFLVVLRVPDEHRVAFALGRRFDALENQREERIGNVGDRDDQLPRFQRAEIFRRGIRLVSEALDGLNAHGAACFGDDIGAAQHARDGGGGNSRAFGDLVNCWHGKNLLQIRIIRLGSAAGDYKSPDRLFRTARLVPYP